MKKTIIVLTSLLAAMTSFQQTAPKIARELQPYPIKKINFLNRNIHFGNYRSAHFSRNVSSFIESPSLQPRNLLRIKGIPLYNRNKRRAKDIFRFELNEGDRLLSVTKCKAVLLQDETFSIFRSKQDSSFFGKRNYDVLEASIQFTNDPGNQWELIATNLNGSRPEAQKGVIKKDSTRIEFTRMPIVLREKGTNSKHENFLSSSYSAFVFTYKNEIVASVSVDERKKDRKIWLKPFLDKEIINVIANAAVVLAKRRNIYK